MKARGEQTVGVRPGQIISVPPETQLVSSSNENAEPRKMSDMSNE